MGADEFAEFAAADEVGFRDHGTHYTRIKQDLVRVYDDWQILRRRSMITTDKIDRAETQP